MTNEDRISEQIKRTVRVDEWSRAMTRRYPMGDESAELFDEMHRKWIEIVQRTNKDE